MKLLFPLLLGLLGTGLGAGAGLFLAPAPLTEECTEDCEDAASETAPSTEEPTYLRLQNQFVVPIVKDELVRALVVLSLSLETDPDTVETIYSREPKLRDAFLRVLFDHAHIGGFDGSFTESGRLSVLRVALLEAAQSTVGREVTDILITDIVRQEL